MTPLLHPGYHKTGTTWMQRRLFIPEHGFAPIFDHVEIDRLIFQPGPYSYDAASVRALAEEKHARIGKDLVPVISSEIMSGQPYIGGRDGALIANRLKETFPEASVMISIREQLGLLPSLYMQYLQAGGTMPFAKFFAGRTVIGNYGFDPDFYEFDKFVGHYVRLFGQEHVMVHPMELLIRDPKAIVRGLRALTGVQTDADKVDSVNRRLKNLQKDAAELGITITKGNVGEVAAVALPPSIAKIVEKLMPYADDDAKIIEIFTALATVLAPAPSKAA